MELTALGRRVLDKIERAGSDARLLALERRSGRKLAIYLGFVGFGNLGDEAIFDALRTARTATAELRGSDFGPWMMRAQTHWTPRAGQVVELALGGGTLVGRRPWGSRLRKLVELFPDAARWAVGVGVEDPESPVDPPDVHRREFDAFLELAPSFARISTRGPRSQAILAAAGVDAEWVGDPALLLGPSVAGASFRERSLLLTVGRVDRLAGRTRDEVLATVGDAAASLWRDGWSVMLVPVSPVDAGPVRAIARSLGSSDRVIVRPIESDWRRFQTLAQAHHVGLHLRLHAGVLSAGAFAPYVQLGYLPKCVDVAESLGTRAHCLQDLSASTPTLVDAVVQVAEQRDEHQQELVAAVTSIRSRLREELDHIGRI